MNLQMLVHWIALYCKNIEIIYCDSFGVENIPEEIKNSIGNKNTKAIIIMQGYFCIIFIDFMLANKVLIDFTSLSSPYDFEKSDNLSYFIF